MQAAMAGKDRVENRVRASVRARMRDSLAERDICILDLSTRGMLATTARPPARGEFVELSIGCNRLTGQVRWSSQRRFGVSLRERVSIAALAEGGISSAELARSVGMARPKTTLLDGLRANPHLVGRLVQYGLLALMAALAAVLIASFTSKTMAPVHQAVGTMNG